MDNNRIVKIARDKYPVRKTSIAQPKRWWRDDTEAEHWRGTGTNA